uniref:Calmodulin n=1 Tax=Macrostomum lignano TaxID=282301 RepID=A0A1I8IF42_9PLAT
MSYPPRPPANQRAGRTGRAAVTANGNRTARIDMHGSFEFDFNESGGVTRSLQFESLDNRLRQKRVNDEMVSDSEIEYMVREKLRREQFAIESMFKASDPARNGRVHRNGLLKILNTVCGHIRIDQFHRLLDRLGLDEQQTVSFGEFKAACGRLDRLQQRQTAERDGALLKPIGAARVFSLLRQEAQAGGFDPRDLLPEACFEPGGLVLKPQLWRALRHGLGVPMAASEFDKIDTQGTGAVSTYQLLGMLGLSAKQFMLEAQPAAPVRSRTVPAMQTSRRAGQRDLGGTGAAATKNEANVNVEVIFNIFRDNIVQQDDAAALRKPPTPASSRREAELADYAEELRYLRRYEMLRQRRPLFEHFMDNLFYIFDEAYNAMLVTFRHCDALQDGYASLTTFQSILQQFGFETRISDLEQFQQRFSMRSARGTLSYTELLDRLNARGPNSLLHKYLLSDRSPVGLDETFTPSSAPLTPYQLELQLLRFFHRDYLQMYFGFLRHDQKKSGIITEAAFRSVLRRLLPEDELGDAQLDEVLAKISRNRSGAVPYRAFLELFHISPNSWNRDAAAGRVRISRPPTPLRPQSASVSAGSAAAALEELRLSRAAQEEAATAQDRLATRRGDRPVSETSLLVEDTLRHRFHQVDKLYKQMDRRNTGRLSKAQFRSLLGAASVTLTDSELDTLWSTLDTDVQGGWTYRQMVRYFMTNLHERTQERLRTTNGGRNGWRCQTADPNVTRLRQWRAANQQRATQPSRAQPAARLSTPQEVVDLRADALIDKCRLVVVENWDELKRVLRHLDPQGTSHIQRAEFRALVQEFKLPLTPTEIDTLSKKFEPRGNGRFNYLDFLKRFVKKADERTGAVLSDKKTGARVRVEEIVERMREKLLSEWKSLLLAFRKFDAQKTGHLTEAELRRVVQSCGFRLSEDDLFILLTEFDLDLDGRVNYQEFVMQLLDVAESP